MTSVRWSVVLVGMLVLLTRQVASAQPACCICNDCAAPRTTCTTAAATCGDIVCGGFGCSEPMLGDSAQCEALPNCATPSPAPTASPLGLALVASALAGFGALQLARRRG